MTTTTSVEWMIITNDGIWLCNRSTEHAAVKMAQHLTGVNVKKMTTVYMYNAEDDELEPVNNELVTIYSR